MSEQMHTSCVSGCKIGVDPELGAVVLTLERGTLMAARVRGGALSDGQASTLVERFAAPFMPSALVLLPAGSATGLGALSSGIALQVSQRVPSMLNLAPSAVLSMLFGAEGTLVSTAPYMDAAKRAFVALSPVLSPEQAELTEAVTLFSSPFVTSAGRFQVAALRAGTLAEDSSRHLVLITELGVTQTVLNKLVARFAPSFFAALAARGLDTVADSFVLLSTGTRTLDVALDESELVALLSGALSTVMNGVLERSFRAALPTITVEIEGAQSVQECQALGAAMGSALRNARTCCADGTLTFATFLPRWRRAAARSGIETLGQEDMVLLLEGETLAAAGVRPSAETQAALWQRALAGETLTWRLLRGGERMRFWL